MSCIDCKYLTVMIEEHCFFYHCNKKNEWIKKETKEMLRNTCNFEEKEV